MTNTYRIALSNERGVRIATGIGAAGQWIKAWVRIEGHNSFIEQPVPHSEMSQLADEIEAALLEQSRPENAEIRHMLRFPARFVSAGVAGEGEEFDGLAGEWGIVLQSGSAAEDCVIAQRALRHAHAHVGGNPAPTTMPAL